MVVPSEVNTGNDQELFIQLRNTFLENLNTKGNYDDYEQIDIERIRNDDHYCKRFILHKKGKLQVALEMVDESLRWRKAFGVKDVTQATIPLEFFQAKAVFPFNKDKEDNPIIMILVRYHKKSAQFATDLRRFVIYWVELMEEQTNGGQMSVIMSCEGAGLSNLDLDLIKFLITLFRSYYPHSLAHILIYEFPWILNPAWKIIKAWLPEDFVDKIKFVNKTTIREYVSEDNLPVDMGGTDVTEYEPPTEEDMKRALHGAEQKRVHFSHNQEYMGDFISNGVSIPNQVVITDDYSIIGGILKISPATRLVFSLQTENVPNEVLIQLSCVSETAISYKVKTNNIASYRVKPSLGVIEPGATIEINVVLLPGFYPQPTDKFLIMAMEISDSSLSNDSLGVLWKSTSSELISDHKLKCVTKKENESLSNEESNVEKSLKNINTSLLNLENKIHSLDAKQDSLQFRQTTSICVTVLLLFLFVSHICVSSDNLFSSVLHIFF